MAGSYAVYRKPRRRKISRVFLHHSASDNPDHDDVSVIRKWHYERGFKDVGYHYFIKKDGGIQIGRDVEIMPAAQKNNNKGTVAICMHGLEQPKFTEKQRQSLIVLCRAINQAHDGEVTFHGHKEVGNTECPRYPYKLWLNLDDGGRMKEWHETLKAKNYKAGTNPLLRLITKLLNIFKGDKS